MVPRLLLMVRLLITLPLLSLLLVACFAAKPDEPYHPQLRLAIAAQQANDIPLAEYYLEDVLKQDIDSDVRARANDMLAEVYWVQAKDKLLLDFTQRKMGDRNAQFWWCRVLERRGNHRQAAKCWEGLREIARMERALRSATIVEELAPTKSFSGLRHD